MKSLIWNRLLRVFALCLFLTAVSLADAETETNYMAIFLQGKKIGYATHTRTVENNKVTTTDTASMTLSRGGQAVTIASQETHIETPDGKPLGFEVTMAVSGIEQKIIGTVADGKITTSHQGIGQTQEKIDDWPQDALLAEGLRLLQKEKGLKPGTSYEARLFRPEMLTSVPAQVRIGEVKKTDLFGRPLNLTEVITTMSIQGQPLTATSYIDKEFKTLKTLVPMMNMELEMIACDKSFAMSDVDVVDFLERLTVASPVKLTNLHTIESAAYSLKPTNGKKLDFPVSDCQDVTSTETELTVTVRDLAFPQNVPFPYEGDDPKAKDALKSADYLQCDNEKIIELAKHAVGTTQDAAAAARKIEAFVDGYITQKDLSVGYASAAEVAQTRQGDCSEHAVLAAAMCRAVGIPARVVCGVVYANSFLASRNIFGGHAWTEVYLDGKWYGLDATRSQQHGVGPGHIAMAHGNGDPIDFFAMTNILGCFKIEKITLTEKKEKTANIDKAEKNG